jgi:hypothetical protein
MCGAIHPLPQYSFMLWCSVETPRLLYLHLGLLNGLLPSGFPTEILCAFLIVSMRATYLTHVIRDFITLTIFVEACKL